MRSDFFRDKFRWVLAIPVAAILLTIAFKPRPHSPSVVPPGQTREARSSTRTHEEDHAFWKVARVPLPDRAHRLILIDPASLGVPSELPAIDHAARLQELESAGADAERQVALIDWFAADPERARDWLASRESLAGFQPALKMISESIAGRGDCQLALEWAALIDSREERDSTVARIYSEGYRQGRFSMDDLAGAPLTEGDRQGILNGSSSD